MFNANDEEDLFPSTTSSNLANLFAAAQAGTAQPDLKYTAPRQPKSADLSVSETKVDDAQPASVFCAKVVHANKLVNSGYVPIGKLGFAAVGTRDSTKEFILYRDKQNIIAKATISPTFVLHEDDGALKFTDNGGVLWTTRFITTQDHSDFIKEITARNVQITKSEPKVKPAIPTKAIPKKETEEVNEEDTQNRAEILSRMARMGQSVLPKANDVTENNGETPAKHEEIDLQHQKNIENQMEKSPSLTRELPKPISYQKQYFNPQVPTYLMPRENSIQIQPYTPFQTYQNQFPQISDNQDFRLFVTETRTQNTELRINLATVSTKLDTVLNEISKLKTSPNTDRLENEFLRSKIYDLEHELGSRTMNNSSLQELKQKIVENESVNKEKQEEIRELNVTNQELQCSLEDAKTKLGEFESSQKNQEILQKEIKDLTVELNRSTVQYGDMEKRFLELEHLHEDLMAENKTLHELNAKLSIDLTKEDNKENVDVGKVKEVMNDMFQNILGEFEEGTSANYKEVKNALAKHMKQATFNIISMIEKE